MAREVPAILLSGDTSFAVQAALRALDGCAQLTKPVDADSLIALIGRMLEESPASWPRSGRAAGGARLPREPVD